MTHLTLFVPPGPSHDPRPASLDGQRPREAHGRPQVLQPEAPGDPGLPFHAEEPGRLARGQRDIEGVERSRQAVAPGLDEGLLARPAAEERAPSLLARQTKELPLLARREVAPRDVLRVRHRALALD